MRGGSLRDLQGIRDTPKNRMGRICKQIFQSSCMTCLSNPVGRHWGDGHNQLSLGSVAFKGKMKYNKVAKYKRNFSITCKINLEVSKLVWGFPQLIQDHAVGVPLSHPSICFHPSDQLMVQDGCWISSHFSYIPSFRDEKEREQKVTYHIDNF